MYIRRYIVIFVLAIITIGILSILIYQNEMSKAVFREMEYESESYGRLARIEGGKIQIYNNNDWEGIYIKGVHISSFLPGYSRNRSSIDKEIVYSWLEQISDLNANVITIPNIQPPSFYDAIYDYNLNRTNPIYVIHEIPLDEKAVLTYYDSFNTEIMQPLMKDIASTIDVIHGRGLILDNSRHSMGIYLKDISKYVLGYIIGNNTSAELVTLTNLQYQDITSYNGKYFNINNGTPFEVYISEILDFATEYEVDKYNQLSLLSYINAIETDPLTHVHETNATRKASINLENINVNYNNMFASYSAHPNVADFLDYEYEDDANEENESDVVFYKYLKEISDFHSMPVIISDTGIPSSRGMSKVDIDDGFNRGNFSEQEQGHLLVKLLDSIYKADMVGAVIYSWQDDWSKSTAFSQIEDYYDESSSTYWHDVQASDESFGLLAFSPGEKGKSILIDGDFDDWEYIDPILYENSLELKLTTDTSYLYLMLRRPGLSLTDNRIYAGLDVSPFSGSNVWENEAEFSLPVDFIIDFNGYNESRIVVHERYNIFDYLYKYYSNLIEKKEYAPARDSHVFSGIYLLNRKNFYFREDNTVVSPIYYQTGRLVHGNGNPQSKDYNSLTDFNKEGDSLEIRIPWALLNFSNPLRRTIHDDFYRNGLESKLFIEHIGISISFENNNEKFITDGIKYKLQNITDLRYYQRLKESYSIVKDYWESNPSY